MQIGEIIRKNRKNKNMTQEEMGSLLGVTAPAVNKWENGNSLPDITLLAPIARLLDVSLDTLLSFQESLTTEEVNCLINETHNRLQTQTFEEVFGWAKKQMEQYPNCGYLILGMSLLLDVQLVQLQSLSVNEQKNYEEYILNAFCRMLNSRDEDIRHEAANCLFNYYLRKEQYDKAEECLAYVSKQNPERKRKQALIYSKTNRFDDAYKSYEELLFSGYQNISLVLNSFFLLTLEEKDMDKAHLLADKQKQLANLFEMGKFHQFTLDLELAAAEKDIDKTILTMEGMLASMDDLCGFSQSSLYQHMNFKDPQEEFITEMKKTIMENFKDEEAFGYLKEDKRWKNLLE